MDGIGTSALTRRVFKRPPSINLYAFSPESIGPQAKVVLSAGPSSVVYPTANLAILVPFELERPVAYASLWVFNGSAVSGNFDVGVYTNDGTNTAARVVSTGSTAQSGTSVPQSVASAFTLQRGSYYLALCCDNTTATFFAKVPALVNIGETVGLAQVANGAVTLPSSLTLAASTTAYLPMFGISQKAAV